MTVQELVQTVPVDGTGLSALTIATIVLNGITLVFLLGIAYNAGKIVAKLSHVDDTVGELKGELKEWRKNVGTRSTDRRESDL
jgi:hypothetical protein